MMRIKVIPYLSNNYYIWDTYNHSTIYDDLNKDSSKAVIVIEKSVVFLYIKNSGKFMSCFCLVHLYLHYIDILIYTGEMV